MIIQPPEGFDRDQLLAELQAAGLVVVSAEQTQPGEYDVTFEEPFDAALVDQVVAGHVSDESRQLDQLIDKARQVWNGQSTFTQAQAQKILAGLVLLENRRR